MKNPAIFSMPLAFLVAWIVSLMTPDLEAQKKFDTELVRTYLGVGAE
jgi:cation/acetate symporter